MNRVASRVLMVAFIGVMIWGYAGKPSTRTTDDVPEHLRGTWRLADAAANDAPDKLNSASRDGWEVVTAQFIPSGDAVGRIGIFALLRRALAGPNTQVD